VDKNTHRHTNLLANESSPYLLQHKHNPVNWQAWNESAWEQARRENKLVLISIGYSACHWCHVMEHQTFEDESAAQLMNEHFVCIKVDREERPDVDQIYMIAVQLMTGHGGWPLNCFATPDGRPVYGGTYFQTAQWKQILLNLADLWKNNPDQVYHYAEQLTAGLQQAELISVKKQGAEISAETLVASWKNWSLRIDNTEGGPNKAPKFPLPNNYQFLLQLGQTDLLPENENQVLNDHVALTLQKMARGGIYDQVGGGFARYSTDELWKVPHFEKMLYDNAQLVSLYAEAYRIQPVPIYKETVYDTLAFLRRELSAPEGVYYSALDADSEGEEGKFYTWTKEELQQAMGADFAQFETVYHIDELGLWEEEHYILMRKMNAQTAEPGISYPKLAEWKQLLLQARASRIRPGLDDKSLCSWNALLIKGYTDAYLAFGDDSLLDFAKHSATKLLACFSTGNGGLFHTYKNGQGRINGFLEDYCFTLEALIALYEATFETNWLDSATALCEYTLAHFADPQSGFFFFTSSADKALIARKLELSDNVVPASNSSMAKALFRLGHLLGKEEYLEKARHMLGAVQTEMRQYGAGYSNWALLQLWLTQPFYEVAIVGKDVDEMRKSFHRHGLANVIFAGSKSASTLPLLLNRHSEGTTQIFVCHNNACQAPVTSVDQALALLRPRLA
jgi:uncharacterized protein YyaL (SSP411 family)